MVLGVKETLSKRINKKIMYSKLLLPFDVSFVSCVDFNFRWERISVAVTLELRRVAIFKTAQPRYQLNKASK